MEGLPLVFGYNREGNQHCWSTGWGEPTTGWGEPRQQQAWALCSSCRSLARRWRWTWKTQVLCCILLGNLWGVICPLDLTSPLFPSPLLWSPSKSYDVVKKKAQHQALLTRIKVQSSLDSAAQSSFPLLYLVGHEPAFGLPDSHLQCSWTETRNHWDHDCNCGFGIPTPRRTAKF